MIRTLSLTRRAAAEPLAFAAITAVTIGFYVYLHAPVLNPPTYLDPWIYTASMVNYHFILTAFPWAYYPSRLPWLLPGIVIHAALPPVPAFFVLHLLFFLAAGLFAFLTMRRFFGRWVALVAYAALLLSPLCFDAYATDYPDGSVLTYLFGSVYFATTPPGSRWRGLKMGAAGFCLAAAIGINLFATFIVLGVVVVYVAVTVVGRGFVRRGAVDAAAALVGAFVLLAVCGIFSKIEGGAFLFFMRQVREAQSVNSADYKAHGYGWLKSQQQLLLPPFALVSLILVWPRGALGRWRTDAGVRFAVGSAGLLALLCAIVSVWEFLFTGDFLETYYYFSLFLVGTILVLGAVIFFGARAAVSGGVAACLTAVLAVVVVALPVFMLYQAHRWSVNGSPLISVALLAAFLGFVLIARMTRTLRYAAVATCVVLLLLFGVSYTAASGRTTVSVFTSRPSTFDHRRDALSVAMQLIDWVRGLGLQQQGANSRIVPEAPPLFWYNAAANPALNGIQSTYLWAATWISTQMPKLDAYARRELNTHQPIHLILLCVRPSCSNARGVLSRSGYDNTVLAKKLLAHGQEHVWATALTLTKFAAT